MSKSAQRLRRKPLSRHELKYASTEDVLLAHQKSISIFEKTFMRLAELEAEELSRPDDRDNCQ